MRIRTRSTYLAMLLLLGVAAVSPAGAVEITAGAKLGYTNTDLVGTNDAKINTKNSAVLGLLLGWEIRPWFSVRFEPDITVKGADIDSTFGDLPTSLNLTYVELPLLLKFKYPMQSDPRSGLFATVGPSLDVLTHATARYAGSDTNVQEHVQGTDVGLSVGAGYDYAAGTGTVSLEARYVFGLADTFDEQAPRQDITGDLRNRALQVSIGWYGPIF